MDDAVVWDFDGQADLVFAEPWQAQCFAMTMQLSQNGTFTWAEWVAVFSAMIKIHPAQPGEDRVEAYYRQWLAALEMILVTGGYFTADRIDEMQALWRQAFLNTHHGQPVVLTNATVAGALISPPENQEFPDAHHQVVPHPVAISAATKRIR